MVVDRALRFLARIGHVAFAGERVTLTELGHRSVRDGKRYVVARQDRRILYFDAFGSTPLTRRYYDSRVVKFLSPSAAAMAASRREPPRFLMLVNYAGAGFRREALAAPARLAERELYNLPQGIDAPESLGEECGSRPRLDAVEAQGWLNRVSRQLRLGEISIPDAHLMAAQAGLHGLATQLGRLTAPRSGAGGG